MGILWPQSRSHLADSSPDHNTKPLSIGYSPILPFSSYWPLPIHISSHCLKCCAGHTAVVCTRFCAADVAQYNEVKQPKQLYSHSAHYQWLGYRTSAWATRNVVTKLCRDNINNDDIVSKNKNRSLSDILGLALELAGIFPQLLSVTMIVDKYQIRKWYCSIWKFVSFVDGGGGERRMEREDGAGITQNTNKANGAGTRS